jgi:hypothetical protein
MKGKVVTVELTDSKPGAVPLDGIMRSGDVVEFMSDMQTEKGPSSGTVISIMPGEVVIRHSDHPGENFDTSHLMVKGEYRHKDGLRKLWILR